MRLTKLRDNRFIAFIQEFTVLDPYYQTTRHLHHLNISGGIFVFFCILHNFFILLILESLLSSFVMHTFGNTTKFKNFFFDFVWYTVDRYVSTDNSNYSTFEQLCLSFIGWLLEVEQEKIIKFLFTTSFPLLIYALDISAPATTLRMTEPPVFQSSTTQKILSMQIDKNIVLINTILNT